MPEGRENYEKVLLLRKFKRSDLNTIIDLDTRKLKNDIAGSLKKFLKENKILGKINKNNQHSGKKELYVNVTCLETKNEKNEKCNRNYKIKFKVDELSETFIPLYICGKKDDQLICIHGTFHELFRKSWLSSFYCSNFRKRILRR